MTLPRILACLSGIAFLIYGILCLTTQAQVEEFHRFGLDRLRGLTGILEILGGAGLLVGLVWPFSLWISSAGLALLMLIAFAVRIRMRDSLALSLPSLLLMLVNLYVFLKSIRP